MPKDFDLEIRKRFAQPLAVESGEFPDMGLITGRMLSFCYGAGLAAGHVTDAPHLVAIATETFIKETLTQIFSRTRSNGPGDSASASFGIGTSWIQTRKYQRQLRQEEEGALRGEVTRDKSGLLPIEAKAASERGPLDIADMRLSLEMSDIGMAQFPVLMMHMLLGHRAGELESWNDYTWINGKPRVAESVAEMSRDHWQANGHLPDAIDLDTDPWWEGAEMQDADLLDGVLDSCLAVRS